jgi:S-DNA-T family DNA segregation ATPase FtsK/SpoIIIE
MRVDIGHNREMFWRRSIDTRVALTFLDDLHPDGPHALAAGKTVQTCNRDQAEAFLKKHTRRSTVCVLLGPLKDGITPQVKYLRWLAVEVPIAAGAALEKKDSWHEPPHMWITGPNGKGIALWRQILPEYVKSKDLDVSLKAFCERFAAEHKCTCEPLMLAIPCPELGNGWRWEHSRGKGKELHHTQIIRTPIAAKPEATSPTAQGRRLQDALKEFGVASKVVEVRTGPVITLYELELAKGVRAAKVTELGRDIARAMKCASARIVETSNKGTIGIELPNPEREIVSLQELLDCDAFKRSKAALPLALGKAIDGAPVIADLAEMPHLMIAGASGKGKSVAINCMILALTTSLTPAQCRFVMIDPKMLELSVYDRIPHMLAPVIVEPEQAVSVLKWLTREMMRRYGVMRKAGVRDLASYNAAAADPMPRIVVIIDEVADLMMVAETDVEYAVQRLSQMARAAGIHLVMATQRPSADVITGPIKANFTSRLAVQTASATDSRVILDENGAEALLGKGDALYLTNGTVSRVHGPFVDDKGVAAMVRKIEATGAPAYHAELSALLGANPEALEGVEGLAGTSGRADASAAQEPQKKLSVSIMKYAAALQTMFTPGGQPIMGAEVRKALSGMGLSWGQSVYDAADALKIDRGERNGVTESKAWTPPSQWPLEFDLASA